MRTRIVAGAALVVLAVSSCSGAGDRLTTGEDYTVKGALAELPPAPSDPYTVWTVDLDAAGEIAGVERPTDLDPQAVVDWIGPLTGRPVHGSAKEGDGEWAPVHAPPPAVTNRGELSQARQFDEQAGWSVIDVHSYAEIVTPPHEFAVLSGDFDDSTLERLPEVGDGVRTVGEGDDGEVNLTGASVVRQTGRPVRMAQDDGLLAVARSTDEVKAWLEGADQSLADDPTMASLADALDETGVVSATFRANDDFSIGNQSPKMTKPAIAQAAADLPEQPFDAVGVGWTEHEGVARIVVVYHFESDEIAQDSIDPLRQVFSEGRDVRGLALSELSTLVDVTSEGPVVTATLDGSSPRAAHVIAQALNERGSPFVHQ